MNHGFQELSPKPKPQTLTGLHGSVVTTKPTVAAMRRLQLLAGAVALAVHFGAFAARCISNEAYYYKYHNNN